MPPFTTTLPNARQQRNAEFNSALALANGDRERQAVLNQLWDLWQVEHDLQAFDSYLQATMGAESDQQDV